MATRENVKPCEMTGDGIRSFFFGGGLCTVGFLKQDIVVKSDLFSKSEST